VIARLTAIGATIWCTDINGTIDARICANGKLTWNAHGESTVPWWSAKTKKKTACVGR
jgi:hypothetical protein